MFYRPTLLTSRFSGVLAAMAIAAGSYSATVSATANDPGFHYETSRTTAIDISLAAGDGNPALLSFYSEGANGLRLLENTFTDTQGSYVGEMRLPAHLTQVVVVVRTAERQDTLTLVIDDQSIVYAE